ncbi:MAG TPA: RNA polymerase sigma-70 factor [Jiangellaceae bacterium]
MTTGALERHDELRPLMFSIAYRMLGSVTEAEDIVQEAFLRLHQSQPEALDSPEAYASTVTTRLAIDHLRSARVRREQYVGTWLPEPLPTADDEADPAWRIERDDTLSMAFLVLLEALSPVERAVFLLRDVFGYDYARIAQIVDKSEANCRQILARAHKHLDARRPRFEASRSRRDELAGRFLAACHAGDTEALEQLLAEDVTFYGDGGGKAPAITAPATGRTRVARFVAGLMRQLAQVGGRLEPTEVNGQPGLRFVDADGNLGAVLELTITDDGYVAELRNVLNPDKLRHLGPLVDPQRAAGT